ncbi:HTH-type transcriptional regulator EthR [Rhodobiaceae bacterium]|nr:HTH-type transcriptional regulator EthR [Rhodobiaceae bacterium]
MMSLDEAAVSPPLQKRSRATLEALLSATEQLLAEKSFADVTVGNIVREAKSSSGSFYARFPDKNALLHALHERFAQRSIQATRDQVAARGGVKMPLDQLCRQMIEGLVEGHLKNRGVLRAALMESLVDPRFAQRALGLVRAISAQAATLIDVPPARGEHMANEVELAVLTIISILDQDLFFGLGPGFDKNSHHKKSKQELDRLCRIFLASISREERSDVS